MVTHFPNCHANYPEKPEGELPQQLIRTEEEGWVVDTCCDCGATEVLKEPVMDAETQALINEFEQSTKEFQARVPAKKLPATRKRSRKSAALEAVRQDATNACKGCGSTFGHNEGCPNALDHLKVQAVLNGVPAEELNLDDMSGQLSTPESALRFILAGNAYVTIRSLSTGTRYTFRVNRADCSRCGKKDCKCWVYPLYFVSLLSGPDNNSDYIYMGSIRDNVLRITRGSKMREDSVPFKAFRWMLEHLMIKKMPPKTELWHEGRCGRCGRKLTVPESIAAGIGPDCAAMCG